MADADNKSEKIAVTLSAQIVHELRNLPRGKTPPEAILLLEVAYKQATGIEDLIRKAYQVAAAVPA